jgi:hypothetical protein
VIRHAGAYAKELRDAAGLESVGNPVSNAGCLACRFLESVYGDEND